MISRQKFVQRVRDVAYCELGPEVFSRGCVVLAAVTQRLAGEVLGEQLYYVSGLASGTQRHAWCETAAGLVVDLQPSPPLVWAARSVNYQPTPVDEFTRDIHDNVWPHLKHTLYVPKGDEVAERIYQQALHAIAFSPDADLDTHLAILRAGHLGLIESVLRSTPAGRVALKATQPLPPVAQQRVSIQETQRRVLSAAGTGEAKGVTRVELTGWYGGVIDLTGLL